MVRLTLCWSVLVLLTLAATALNGLLSGLGWLPALSIVPLKGWLIIDHFMELKQSPLWRGLMGLYMILIPAVLCIVLWMG